VARVKCEAEFLKPQTCCFENLKRYLLHVTLKRSWVIEVSLESQLSLSPPFQMWGGGVRVNKMLQPNDICSTSITLRRLWVAEPSLDPQLLYLPLPSDNNTAMMELYIFSKRGIAQPLHQYNAHGLFIYWTIQQSSVKYKVYVTDQRGLRQVSTIEKLKKDFKLSILQSTSVPNYVLSSVSWSHRTGDSDYMPVDCFYYRIPIFDPLWGSFDVKLRRAGAL
jgi:hypothetical protein